MSKSNVHPDHYKVGGRDRQDDAAAARFVRANAAKSISQQRPDRMTKGPYFQRREAAPAARVPAGRPAKPAQKKSSPRAGTAKKAGARKAAAPKTPATPKAARKTGRTARSATRKK
jgi:hypothetical protein